MNKNNPLHLSIILVTVALAAWFLYMPVRFYMTPESKRLELVKKEPTILKKIFSLGLDLQGGMRLVLEVDRSSLEAKQAKDLLDRAYTVIENRVNALGVAEPSIQKQGIDRLIVELPGLKDEARAKDVIGRTAQLEFQLLREPIQLTRAIKVIDDVIKGHAITDNGMVADSAKNDTTAEKQKEAQAMADRLFTGADKAKDSAATLDAKAQTDTSDMGITSFKDLLASVGEQIGCNPENRYKVDKVLRRQDVREALARAGLGGNSFLWSHDTNMVNNFAYYSLYYVKTAPELRGDAIKDARASIDQSGMRGGEALVNIEMNPKGARRFSSVTGANTGKFLAIVLDSTVYSAPRIIQKISGGRAEITGNFTMDDAKNLAIVLRAGALPAPMHIIEERTIGPSLGQDSIRNGVRAGIVGVLAIFLFIMFYYRASGVYACIALVINMLFTLAVMAGLNQTLTLPGICGLVLNLGMAVDANVLICERIREELALGKTVRSAIETGYNRVLIVILDSNLTTLITAFILLGLGSGPIKGFAITLILGISISMYTSLFVTHFLYNVFTNKNAVKLSI